MPVDPEIVLSVGLPVVGGVVWMVRQEGRINAHDEKHRQHECDKAELKADVVRVLDRVDAIYEHLVGKK